MDDFGIFGEAVPQRNRPGRGSSDVGPRLREARAKVPMGRDDGYATHVELTDEAKARLRKAEEVLRELGAKMQAFAGTDRVAAVVLSALGTDLRSAGFALIGLSNSIGTYGQQRHDAQQRVAATLGVPPT